MTENEVIKTLFEKPYIVSAKDYEEAKNIAIQALKEIQKYRAINAEIRVNAISEFAERLKNSPESNTWCCHDSVMEFCNGDHCEECMEIFKKKIDEIAEEMRGAE